MWSGGRDAEGHRTYKLTCRVTCNSDDGPSTVLAAPGLPSIGSQWIIGNDTDPWAFCTPEVNVTPVITGEPGRAFDLEYTFSTKPWRRPQGSSVGNPLLEPPKISITFTKTTEEASVDRFNRPIVNSAWERLRGKQVEFDSGMVQVKIEQNLGILDLATLTSCFQTVNAVILWGMPPRTIKLSEASINEQYYGLRQVYYQRSLQFEVNFKGWDKALLDEGTKVLFGQYISAAPGASGSGTGSGSGSGGPPPKLPSPPDPIMWKLLPVDAVGTMPDPNNPTHFVKHMDRFSNPSRVVLNGAGIPAGTVSATGRLFLCIQAGAGNKLTDGNYWVSIPSPPFFLGYTINYDWKRGDLIIDNINNRYVATANTASGVGWIPDNWTAVPVFSDAGVYDKTRGYFVGEYVIDPTPLSAGVVRVQKYNEANFVALLGIPASLIPTGLAMLTPEWLPPGHPDNLTGEDETAAGQIPAPEQPPVSGQRYGARWDSLPDGSRGAW
jgi:hypothetical protein